MSVDCTDGRKNLSPRTPKLQCRCAWRVARDVATQRRHMPNLFRKNSFTCGLPDPIFSGGGSEMTSSPSSERARLTGKMLVLIWSQFKCSLRATYACPSSKAFPRSTLTLLSVMPCSTISTSPPENNNIHTPDSCALSLPKLPSTVSGFAKASYKVVCRQAR